MLFEYALEYNPLDLMNKYDDKISKKNINDYIRMYFVE